MNKLVEFSKSKGFLLIFVYNLGFSSEKEIELFANNTIIR